MSGSLGVDIGGSSVKLVRLGEGGAVQRLEGVRSDFEGGSDGLLERILECATKQLGALPSSIGIAVAGLIDRQGVVRHAPNLSGFTGVDIVSRLGALLPGSTLALDNDVNCALLGEQRRGAARGAHQVAMLSLGTGVGGALMLEGKLVRGIGGTAAEFGHLVLDPNGDPCACGQEGHVESYLGSGAIVARAGRTLASEPAAGSALARRCAEGADLTPELISECAHGGDGISIAILAELGFYLGLALANLAHAFNPELCVIGGGVAGCGDYLLEPARATLRERAMEAPAAQLRVETAELGEVGAAVGAALLVDAARDDSDADAG